MNRPLLWVAIPLVAGTFAAAWGLLSGIYLPLALAVVGFALQAGPRRFGVVGLAFVYLGAGAIMWNARHIGPPGDPLSRFAAAQPESLRYTLEGTVQRPDILLPDRTYMQFQLRVDKMGFGSELQPIRGGVIVRWRDPAFSVYSGERVRLSGYLQNDLARVNWQTPSVEDHLRRNGIHTALPLKGEDNIERIAGGPRWSPTYWASRLRTHQAKALANVVPNSSLPFVLTVWLGDRRLITNDAYKAFRDSGTAHILAVSGVHMGIIFVTLTYVLRLVIHHRRLRTFAVMAAILLFALVAGARISSLRAAVMIVLFLTADLFDREPDAPTALSIAAILFTLHNPDVVLDAGYQLSFLSIASILLFKEPIETWLLRLPDLVRHAFSTTLAVQVLVLPIAISFFYVLPAAAPLANLLVIPLLSVVLWICFLTSVSVTFSENIGLLFGHALDIPVFFIRTIAETVSSFSGTHFMIVSPTALAMACYWTTVAFAVIRLRAERHKTLWSSAAMLAFAATLLFWTPLRPQPQVNFLDVGHGDATFIRTPGGSTVLIDGGNRWGKFDAGERLVAPFLWSNQVTRLDCVIATHADGDHIGGLAYIIEHFPVGVLYLGPIPSPKPLEEKLIAQCEAAGVPIRRIARGETIPLRGAQLETLHPPAESASTYSKNNSSLVLRLTWPGFSALLTGDIERSAESELMHLDCKAAILRAPHHASKTSSSRGFIEAVAPEFCTVSAGRRSYKSVVSPDVLKRYENFGIGVYRTDILGGLRATLKDERIAIEGARQARAYLIPSRAPE